MIIAMSIPITLLIMVVSIYIYTKVENEKNNDIQIVPPENMNPLELAYIYNGKISKSEIVALIPYLVDKGYIEMEFPFDPNNKEVCDFKMTKIKEYDGNNALERYVLNTLFAKSDIITYSEVCNNEEYLEMIEYCMQVVNSDRNHNIIYNKVTKKIKRICNIYMIIGFIIYQIIFCKLFNPLYFLLIVPVQILLISSISQLVKGIDSGEKGRIWKKDWGFILVISLMVIMFSLPIVVLNGGLINSIIIIIGIFIFIIARIIIGLIAKRTTYGEILYQKTVKFRKFLELTPKEGIEMQFNENKDCYFDIFSYCFALGMSQKCISEFNEFFNNNLFTVLYENKIINEKIDNVKKDGKEVINKEKFDTYMIDLLKKGNEKLIAMLKLYDDEFLGEKLKDTDIEKISYKYLGSQLKELIIDS